MIKQYEPADIEAQAQTYWRENHSFDVTEDLLNREKFFSLCMLPYPSGDLHMGHVRNYTIGDVISRYQWMNGKNVMQPMGWDAFGLPAENAAIKHKLPPAEWTQKNIKRMRKQFQQLGYAIDWKREFATCDPEYYRWEQWLFLQLYKKGMVYKKNATVNWDPVDQTVLANEQVKDGKGWRSGATVIKKTIPQWFFRITDYADELLDGLDQLPEWPEKVKEMQRHWIGRSKGLEIEFAVSKKKETLSVFTTRADTLMGCTYLAIAPDHALASSAAERSEAIQAFVTACAQSSVAEADLATQEKLGIASGFTAIHPITREELPIWIANFVVSDYGSGAVMCVPAHDQRDFEFASKYDLPIKVVIQPAENDKQNEPSAITERGTLVDSGAYTGLHSNEAIESIATDIINASRGQWKTHYRLRDWGVSRQRYWGAPIPMINCKHCGEVPVPDGELPVTLPESLIPDGKASPLLQSETFLSVDCPQCGKPAKRETDTMDTFVESSWYYARYCSYDQHAKMLDDRAKYWTPVDQYVGGVEHAVMHLLYARFMHKLLRDEGLLNSDEPFQKLLTQGMVLKDGRKMSKSVGNIVAPLPLIKEYGADTVRLFIIFAAPPEQSLEWSDAGVEGAHRFLNKVWGLGQQHLALFQSINKANISEQLDLKDSESQGKYQTIHRILQQANKDIEKNQFNTVVSACMKLNNHLHQLDVEDPVEASILTEGYSILLRLLSPITPHICHHLWRETGFGLNILESSWPKVNLRALQSATIKMIVQINGKKRTSIQVSTDLSDEAIKDKVTQEPALEKYIQNKTIKKIIIVPNRLINVVI